MLRLKVISVFIIVCLVYVVFSLVQDEVTLVEDAHKTITVENAIKSNIDENYIISRKRVEGIFELEDVIYSDISYVYDKGNSKVVNIYLVYDDFYEIVYVDANPLSNSSIDITSEDNLTNVYYAFIEYDTVGAITYTSDESITSIGVFESENMKRSEVVGGNIVKRVFKQEAKSTDQIEASFIIYNAFTYDEITSDTRNFGSYKFIIK